jgi:hypothetical protein
MSSSTTSTLSSTATVHSHTNSSRQVVNGLFLSPPPAPLKAFKSWRAASSPLDGPTYNLAKVNCFNLQLQAGLFPTSPGNSWTSFKSNPSSPMTGFMDSPIGWPSLPDVPGSGGGCSVACSLMNGKMIESPGLGHYPSPSATLRRVSDATHSALQKQQLPHKMQSRRASMTPAYYKMGQSQSFTYNCQNSAMDESLRSLRVNLAFMYSEDSPHLQSKHETNIQPQLDTFLSPIDRSMFVCTSIADGT